MIKKLLLAGFLALAPIVAWAGDPFTAIGNANYAVLTSDVRLVPTVALTANRTITLPYAGGTCLGASGPIGPNPNCGTSLEIIDALGNVGGANSCLVITAQSGDLLNGTSGGSITFCSSYGRALIRPIGGTAWVADIYGPGQLQGTATNDNAQAGMVGEFQQATCPSNATTATVTITIAAPGVITWTGHGFTAACPVVFTTTGALPTGITSGTTYYIVPASITTNTFQIATTIANALAATPTSITTTGSQSGTQTGTAGVALTTATGADVTGLSLTAGDWDCRAIVSRATASSFAATVLSAGVGGTAATIPAQGILSSFYYQTASNVMGALGEDSKVGPARFSLASTTIEHLSVKDTFSTGTDNGFGTFECRRVR